MGETSRGDGAFEPPPHAALPPGVIAVFPAPGEICSSLAEVRVVLRPPTREVNEPIRLWVDGTEVTGSLTILETMSFPPTRTEAIYHREADPSERSHDVHVSFPGPSGTGDYRWSFTVSRAD